MNFYKISNPNRIKQWLFYSMILILPIIGCVKSQPMPYIELPPITQSGANTFGCKINDAIFKVDRYYVNPGNNYIDPGDFFRVDRLLWDPTSITLIARKYKTAGMSFNFYDRGSQGNLDFNFKPNNSQSKYSLDTTKPRTFILNKSNDKILAGTFDCWVIDSLNPENKLHISEGRFDIKEP